MNNHTTKKSFLHHLAHHTEKVWAHLQKHHKKYIFGVSLAFGAKLLIGLLATIWVMNIENKSWADYSMNPMELCWGIGYSYSPVYWTTNCSFQFLTGTTIVTMADDFTPGSEMIFTLYTGGMYWTTVCNWAVCSWLVLWDELYFFHRQVSAWHSYWSFAIDIKEPTISWITSGQILSWDININSIDPDWSAISWHIFNITIDWNEYTNFCSNPSSYITCPSQRTSTIAVSSLSDGRHTLILKDFAGNTTGLNFYSDATPIAPSQVIFSGNWIINWQYIYLTGWNIFEMKVLTNKLFSSFNHYINRDLQIITNNYNINPFTTGYIFSWNISTLKLRGMADWRIGLWMTGINSVWIESNFSYNQDSSWNSIIVDTTFPIASLLSPANLSTTTWNTIQFTWTGSDTNMSGYILTISGTAYNTWISTIATTQTVTIQTAWTYTRYVTAIDKAWNTTQTPTYTFIIPGFIASFNLPNTIIIGSNTWTNNATPIINLQVNKPSNYTITGDLGSYISSNLTASGNIWLNLSAWNWAKNIYLTFTAGSEIITGKTVLYLDTTAPTAPTAILPVNGWNTSGTFTMSWTASTDSGWIGISGYYYQISSLSNLSNTIKSWFTTTNSVTINNGELPITGTFYWQVTAKDNLGNSAVNTMNSFNYTWTITSTPTAFTFDRITSARTNRTYQSNTVTIQWMSPNTTAIASVSNGVLYIINSTGTQVGTTGTIKNWDQLKVELISSNSLNTTISSVLTINSFTTIFSVKTSDTASSSSSSNLESSKKTQVLMIFNVLKDTYSTSTKQNEFMTAFSTMIQDRIDTLNDKTQTTDVINEIAVLDYLKELIDDEYGISTESDYEAPNGKMYRITYDSSRDMYTSPDFRTTKYFSTLTQLKDHIDLKNPSWSSSSSSSSSTLNYDIDSNRFSAPYTAPNGKVYQIFRTTDNTYGAYEMKTMKLFSTVPELKAYIKSKNLR